MNFKSLIRFCLFQIMVLLMAIAAIPMFTLAFILMLIFNRKEALYAMKESFRSAFKAFKEVSGDLLKGR